MKVINNICHAKAVVILINNCNYYIMHKVDQLHHEAIGKSSWKKWAVNNSTVVCWEKHYRRIVCFESVGEEVQRRSEGATLCVCGPGESVWQGAKRRGVVLHDNVWSGREVRENSTRYVCWQCKSGEVCCRSEGGIRGEGETAPRIGVEPLLVCNGDG